MGAMPDFEELARHRGVPEVLAVVAAALVVEISRAYFWHLGRREGAIVAVCVVGCALVFSAIGSWRADRRSRPGPAPPGPGGAPVATSPLVPTLTPSLQRLVLAPLTAWPILRR